MQVRVESLSIQDAATKGITAWPVWKREASRFPWKYDVREECYILQGRARIETEDGNVEIEQSDYVVFPAGLECVWDIQEPISKHYRLGDAGT